MKAIADELARRLGPGQRADIVTTHPNRYRAFRAEAPGVETRGPITVHRIKLPGHDSGMWDQSRAFITFARRAWRLVRGRKYDAVFASSSRLSTAFLGAAVSRRLEAPFYADFRDIFTDSIRDVLPPLSPLRLLLPVFRGVEKYTVKCASRINLVSEGFRDHFNGLDGAKVYRFYPNGIDEQFIGRDYRPDPGSPGRGKPVEVLYAGNVGEGQGLHRIIPPLARRLGGGWRFTVVGAGGAMESLRKALAESGVENVVIKPPVERRRLPDMYRAADILFLHLNDYPAFRKVLPSKIFEYAATGKPIAAGVDGYAAAFIAEHVAGAAVFPPCSVSGAEGALKSIPLGLVRRDEFIRRFRRRPLAEHLVADLLALAGNR